MSSSQQPVSSETLSAYLDGALPDGEAEALERRLEEDAESRARLDGMRHVVHGLRRIEPIPAPPTLEHLVARRIALERTRVGWLDRLEDRLRTDRGQNPFLGLFGVVIALALFTLLFSIAVHRNQSNDIEVVFPPQQHDPSRHVIGARKELAGRVFFWTGDAWRQREVGAPPTLEIDLTTPAGERWLADHPELAPLTAEPDPWIVRVGDVDVLVRPRAAPQPTGAVPPSKVPSPDAADEPP